MVIFLLIEVQMNNNLFELLSSMFFTLFELVIINNLADKNTKLILLKI